MLQLWTIFCCDGKSTMTGMGSIVSLWRYPVSFSRRDGDGIHCDFPVGHRQRADGDRRARRLVRVLRVVEEVGLASVAGPPIHRAVFFRHDVEPKEHDIFEAEAAV